LVPLTPESLELNSFSFEKQETDKQGFNVPCYLLFLRKKQNFKITSIAVCEVKNGSPVNLPEGHVFLSKTVTNLDATFDLGFKDGRKWGICFKREAVQDTDPNCEPPTHLCFRRCFCASIIFFSFLFLSQW